MQKIVEIDGLDTPVLVSRRKGTRHLRISIRSDGVIKLSVPYGVSEKSANSFIKSKIEWITSHQKPRILIKNGDHIGKSHKVEIEHSLSNKISTRLNANTIAVKSPSGIAQSSAEVQKAIKKAAERALLKESKHLLPQRVEYLSNKYEIPYNTLKIKKLKSRWGSCDNKQNIILNSYLIQLDWELIDYVILHELTHTKFQHHQSDFWSYLERILPDYKVKRKTLKLHPTDITPTNF